MTLAVLDLPKRPISKYSEQTYSFYRLTRASKPHQVVLQLLAFLFMSPYELVSLFKEFPHLDSNQSAHETRSKQSSHKSDTGSARRRSKGNKTGQKRKHEGDGW